MVAARTLKTRPRLCKNWIFLNNTNLQLYSWVASAGSENQWVLFTQQKHIYPKLFFNRRQVICITTKTLHTLAVSGKYAKAVLLGKKLCVLICRGMWWIYCCIWVVGIALTASLWPHYYFTSDSSVMSSDSFGLFVFMVVLFDLIIFYLLPSDTAGRFCSVWNMILKSFTHLNFRMTEKRQKRLISCPF